MSSIETPEPIALVGIGCRFPGANNLEEYWRVLSKGENHVLDVTPDRWNVDAFYDPDPEALGKTYVRKVGLVKGHEEFDNKLFDINDIESSKMDPQQRLVLAATYMALEDGGFKRSDISGSNTGVYVGVMNHDYMDILSSDMTSADNYSLTGGTTSIAAARVSFAFNLLGPAMVVDTACSSSLIAIHLGSQALRAGDCDMAICGGVNSIMLPEIFIPLCKARMVSPTGYSQSFSDTADGYARGEGCGMVVLKRLANAIESGDRVWAVVMTSSNQDGRTATPITAPSGSQQTALLHKAYKQYNINPADIQYMEAHGTGTPVGDPIEANSIGGFFGSPNRVLYMGSVKTNIGHLESASGVAGLIKVILMMKNSTIVQSLHFSNPNPKIDLKSMNLEIPIKQIPWEAHNGNSRLGCVNSFGFGGSNAHAIIQQNEERETQINRPGHNIIVVTGNSEKSLKRNLAHLLNCLDNENENLSTLSFTSTCRRDHYSHRQAYHALSMSNLTDQIQRSLNSTVYPRKDKINIIFVFGGMGTFWNGMFKTLMKSEKVFLDFIRTVDKEIEHHCNITVEGELLESSKLDDPIVGPLVLFASQLALVALWRHWGIEPDMYVGQSVGEVAAAYASGRLSLKDAVQVIYVRSKLLSTVTGGKMLMIRNYPVDIVKQHCSTVSSKLEIALYYSRVSCTVAGGIDDIQALIETINSHSQNVSMSLLNVATAFHSAKMDHLVSLVEKSLSSISSVNSIENNIVSSVTGKLADGNDFVTPGYWSKNIRQSVLFQHAIEQCTISNESNVFIEIGPKPVLRAHARDIFGDQQDVIVLPSIMQDSEEVCMLSSLCKLFVLGIYPNWQNIVPLCSAPGHEPRYQFEKKRLLYQPAVSQMRRFAITSANMSHPFIRMSDTDTNSFVVDINEKQTPFIFQHQVNGKFVVQGSTYVEVVLFAASKVLDEPVEFLSACVHFVQPCRVQLEQNYTLTCSTKIVSQTIMSFSVFNTNNVYAYGFVRKNVGLNNRPVPSIGRIKEECSLFWNKEDLYQNLSLRNLKYGDGLSIVSKVWANTEECICEIESNDLINKQLIDTHVHPVVLDAMAQSTCIIMDAGENTIKTMLPSTFGLVSVYQRIPAKCMCFVKLVEKCENKSSYNMLLVSLNGNVIIDVQNFVIKAVGQETIDVHLLAYVHSWIPLEQIVRKENVPARDVIVVCNETTMCDTFKETCTKSSFYQTSIMDFNVDRFKELYSIFNENVSEMELNSGIVFCQHTQINNQIVNSEGSYKDMIQVCENVKGLILLLSQHGLDVPLIVLTKGTQAIYSDDGQSESVNVYGSQLWGMIRCVMKEGLYPNIYLVDIADTSTGTIEAVTDILNQQLQHYPSTVCREMSIRCGKLLKTTVVHCEGSLWENTTLSLPWNGCDAVELFACGDRTRSEEVNLRRLKTENNENVNLMEGTMGKYLLHKSSFYPRTLGGLSGKADVWPDVSDNGVRMLTLEAALSPIRPYEQLVACYPMTISNEVSVPEPATIPLRKLPCYQPGLLTTLVLVWYLKEYLNEKQNIYMIVDDMTFNVGKIIFDVLRVVGFRKVTLTKNFPNCKLLSLNVLVLMSSTELTTILEVGHRQDTVNKILIIDGMVGQFAAGQLARAFSNSDVTHIYPRNIFQPFYLIKTVPKIKLFLEKHRNLLSQSFKGITESNFKAFACGVETLAEGRCLSVVMNKKTLFHENASYVVVGGLGGLGWISVGMIAEMGGGLLAIVSRKPPNDEMLNKITELKNHTGVEIICLQADVTDETDIIDTLNQLSTNYPSKPIRGIFQGAGTLDDSVLFNMTSAKIESVALPKIKGTLNLHKASLNFNLDYFIMHSSVVSIIGNAGQSNYGAGNSFMDSFAHYRRQQNLPGQSINWGPLEVGMASSNPHIAKQLQEIGYISLNKEQIKECLLHMIISNAPQACYMEFDWLDKHKHILLSTDIRNAMTNRDNYLAEHLGKQVDLDMVMKQPPDIRLTYIFDYTQDVLAAVLSVDRNVIDPSTELTALGLDSMLVMTLANRFRRDLNVKVAFGDILDCSSVQLLVLLINTKISEKKIEESDVSTLNKYHPLLDLKVPLLSPIQQHIHQAHIRQNGENDIKFAVEIIIEKKIGMIFLQEAIQHVIERNNQLRTIYTIEHGTVIPVLAENVKVDELFKVVSCKPASMWKLVCEIAKERFDLSTQLPLKVLCLETETGIRIGFVFHQICFDLKSMQLFFNEFKNVCLSKVTGKDLDHVTVIDVAQEFHATFEPIKGDLQEHWLSKINEMSEISTISFSPDYKGDICGEYRTIGIELPSDVLARIKLISVYLKITHFQFYTSVHQLLLHLISGQNLIPIKTVIDVRLFIPSLQNVITRCVNGVPILANISTEENIQQYLVQNSKSIADTVLHGLYPQGLILSKIPSDKVRDIFRHSVVVEDMSDFRSVLNESKQFGMNLVNYGPVYCNNETRLVIWSEIQKKTITLQLDYLPSLVNDKTAKYLLHSYTTLIDWVLDNTSSSISDIPPSIYENCVMRGVSPMERQETIRIFKRQDVSENQVSESDQLGFMTAGCFFKKISRQGLERQVFLILQMDGTSSKLQWGHSEKKLSRQLQLHQITNIYWNVITDRNLLIIRTSGRRFYFVAPNKQQAKQWMTGFRVLFQ